jgi:cell wall-associated NlpC family hydrolase
MEHGPVHIELPVYHARRVSPTAPARRALLLLLALLAVGCSRAPRPAVMPDGSVAPGAGDRVAARLRDAVERWRRDPEAHPVPGGLDCSAFVVAVYRDLFGLELPRSSEDMAQSGRPVDRDDLRPGDLVFFRPGSGRRHVGFYVGKGEFGHVSERSGIRISRLAEKYWKACYWTARRVLRG